MEPLSASINERARKIESLILHRLSSKTQTAVALDLGVSEATINRYKGGDKEEGVISKAAKLIAVLELKIASDDSVEVSQEEIQALKTLAAKYFVADEIRREKATNSN